MTRAGRPYVRCPMCGGHSGELDRFNHFRFNPCLLCGGTGKVRSIVDPQVIDILKLVALLRALSEYQSPLAPSWAHALDDGYLCEFCGMVGDPWTAIEHDPNCAVQQAHTFLKAWDANQHREASA